MKIRLISVGTRMPAWVVQGVHEYQKRLPADFEFSCIEVPLARRSKNSNTEQIMQQEADQLLAKVGDRDYLIAMDVRGKALSTEQMAARVSDIRDNGHNLSLLVGGPDGLAQTCLQRANEKWSLSALTLPHPLVRILVAEQMYRVWSLISGHPYHRA